MSYGEAVLERGAGRRYRWKGRPGLPHKAIKNGACLSDGMAREAPAEMGGFASSAPSARSGGEGALEGLQLLEGTLCPLLPPAAFFYPSSSRPLPRRWGKREDGGGDGEGVGLPLLFSALLFFFFWGFWRCPGAVLVLAALHPCCRNSLPLAVCGR